MRVLVLADASSYHTAKWMEAWQARGDAALCASVEPARPELADRTVRLNSPFRKRPLSYLWTLGQLRAIIRSFKPTLLNAHMAPGYGLLAALAQGKRKLLVSLWGPDVLETPKRGILHRGALRFVFRRAHLLQTDARIMDRILMDDFGVPAGNIFYMVYGLADAVLDGELPEFRPGPPWRIMSHRKLEPVYAPLAVVEALAKLRAQGVELSVCFASGGSLEREVKRRMKELGVRGEVTGWISQAELFRRISQAHVFVSASLTDSTPVSLLEAMALGAFPVVSDLPALREWVVEGLNGTLFDPRDPKSLASAITRALEAPDLMARARGINKNIVRERARWSRDFERLARRVEGLQDTPLKPVHGRKHLPWSYL